MALTLRLIRATGSARAGEERTLDHGQLGIGRDPGNEWVLADPEGTISRRHCSIRTEHGQYVLTDTSTNGVSVNGRRLGRNQSCTLADGDRLTFAGFELAIGIAVEHRLPCDPLLPPGPADASPAAVDIGDATAVRAPELWAAGGAETRQIPVLAAEQPGPGTAAALLAAFFDGARLPVPQAGADGERQMRELGQSYRLLLQGTIDLLRARADLKQAFRIKQTQIADTGNNPLKFAANVETALELTGSSGGEYLGLEAAVLDALKDLRVHQSAVTSGLQGALLAAVQPFEPDGIRERIESSGGAFGRWLHGGTRVACWEELRRRYDELARDPAGRLQDIFENEFRSVYERQEARLNRR